MRLLLDANLSTRKIGEPLRQRGHDVRSLASEPDMEGLDDPAVLALAASEERILITRNSRDFAPLLRQWAEAQRPHAGCILIWTLDHHEFGPIIGGVVRLLTDRPDQAAWRDLTVAI